MAKAKVSVGGAPSSGPGLEGDFITVTVHLPLADLDLLMAVAQRRKMKRAGKGRASVSEIVRELVDAHREKLKSEIG